MWSVSELNWKTVRKIKERKKRRGKRRGGGEGEDGREKKGKRRGGQRKLVLTAYTALSSYTQPEFPKLSSMELSVLCGKS
jgi:hypothetical protein